LIIETARLRLRPWREDDRDEFGVLNADAEVSRDLGGPLTRAASDAKLDRYIAAFRDHGFCRWVIETRAGDFIGYAGVMPVGGAHPLGAHNEIGWRLKREAWGRGQASEAAGAALRDAFLRVGLAEVLSYTAPDNLRSQAVMQRLQLERDPARDFVARYDGMGDWHGLVWVARRGQSENL
jgi:RimJ/RimL family protein N-acetyltransferase